MRLSAFAETEKFLDTPVKRYSSGMYVRLAFAVAAHLEPEILVIDEVLAVGDASVSKRNASAKCARLPKATAERCYSSAIIWLRYEISAQHRFGSNRVAWPKRAMLTSSYLNI